ncbi:unnamed protein product [Adineta steineri]|uniref:Uncharacterized protein n=1 Tax=Adineta steineri TaxID=433720 RepID=A0A815QXX9_9BILA|nr:unnamed protein product [Adineta steineri]CAF1468575.1 unnamed protein product [Adineta steineri]CAF3751696.1 unnamed protein product [Adineta steineri]CAF4002653.1 unnamed protein product [Adineta steineri]
MTAKRLGQMATRIYIVLFTVGIIILVLYTIVQPQPLIKTFDKPSFNLYNQLSQKHGDKLKCPCASIVSTYERYVSIEPVFHEICSSPYVEDQWQLYLVAGLVSNLSNYAQRDYRRFLYAHLRFLTELCQLSKESTDKAIKQFLTSLSVSAELMSEIKFHERLELLIEQVRSNAPAAFAHNLLLIRNINLGNAIISAYGTNYEYIFDGVEDDNSYFATQAILYDDGCTCGLYLNCTTQASFIEAHSSETIAIKGLKIGCTPSESLHASTLECFYNQSCLNLIQRYTNSINQQIRFPQSDVLQRSFHHVYE